ncbi:MAG: complex I NDUFA9 subunit family protein [Caldimonas sp.]
MQPIDSPLHPQPNMGQNILVLGGTGFLGRSLCRQLTAEGAHGRRVTVATRSLPAAQHLRKLPGLQVAQVNISEPAQLARLVKGHDAVVNLVAILHGDEATFRRIHVDLVGTLANVCKATGRSRVIHLSALGVGSGAPSLYLRSKSEGETYLKTAGVDATILRPSVIFGANDRFLNLFARLLRFSPVFPLACARALFQPVWVEDVAAGIVRCLQSPESIGRVYECVGPKVYELIELVRLAGEWSGHARPVLPLPRSLGELQASVLELMPGETLMSRDNLLSMLKPNIASGLPTLKDLGIEASALATIAPRYLGGSRAA